MNTKGNEIPNHMEIRAKNVPNGIADDECLDQIKRLRMNIMPKRKPGTKRAVF